MIREMRNEGMKRIEEIWLEDSIRLHNFVPDAQNDWPRKADVLGIFGDDVASAPRAFPAPARAFVGNALDGSGGRC
jgi:hypothetical protein